MDQQPCVTPDYCAPLEEESNCYQHALEKDCDCEDIERPTTGGKTMVTRQDVKNGDGSVFDDDLADDIRTSLHDWTHAAWNAWTQAGDFKDNKALAYYMKFILELQKFKATVDKIKK